MEKTDKEIVDKLIELLDERTNSYIDRDNIVQVIENTLDGLDDAEEALSNIGGLSEHYRF